MAISQNHSTLKQRLDIIINDSATRLGKFIDLSLLLINFFACALYVYRSYLGTEIPSWLRYSEITVIAIFAIEYAVRVWIAPRRSQYIFSFYGLIDLLSILPFVVFFSRGLSFFSALKILRILRFLRFL